MELLFADAPKEVHNAIPGILIAGATVQFEIESIRSWICKVTGDPGSAVWIPIFAAKRFIAASIYCKIPKRISNSYVIDFRKVYDLDVPVWLCRALAEIIGVASENGK